MWREVVIMEDIMVVYDNGERVTTPNGRCPGYRGCLNDFDRAMLAMIDTVRHINIYTIDTM